MSAAPASVTGMTEQRQWRHADADLFRFTTTERRDLNIAVMTAFERASTLEPALNLDRVREALEAVGWDGAVDDAALHQVLESLVGWKLLDVSQDHGARYASPEDFERKNLQWALTRRGEAAVGGLLSALESLRLTVGLQPAVLDAIGDALHDLAVLLGQPRSDSADGRIHVLLAQVESQLAGLVASVRQFNGQLQRLLREDAVDDAIFSEVKRRTVAYLEEYVAGVDRPQRRLRESVLELAALGPATVFDRALAGANLAPTGGEDPGPAWIAERRHRWSSLRAWFAPEDAQPPRIDGLLGIARTAIVELLRVLERRWDRRRRSASVAHDFRQLASWFAELPGDDEAHRLFGAAFGLWPARHAHLLPPDGAEVLTTQSWLDAPAVEVAPSLRTTGSLTNRGRVAPVRDPSASRAIRQREQAAALATHRELQASLLTRGEVRLSSLPNLTPDGFRELLTLLAAALDAPADPRGRRHALSADGRLEVALRKDSDDRAVALRTREGVLRGLDFWLSISLAAGAEDEDAGRWEASSA